MEAVFLSWQKPYFILNNQQIEMNKIFGKDLPIAMEYMEQCVPYLHKIEIINPESVTDELLVTGAKRGNLYPDMQSVSQDYPEQLDRVPCGRYADKT